MLTKLTPAVALDAAAPAAPLPPKPGNGRLFENQTFHFEALRALMETPAGCADIGDVLETVKLISDGDVQSWFAAWSETADRVWALAESAKEQINKGSAYLRAHNYQRTAEFLLPPNDPKRPLSWEKTLSHFYKGLDVLEVNYERITTPYAGANLRALYFPGAADAEKKPLFIVVGGYDSILEELYPMLGKAALDRGYAVLLYEGPGQGQPLRDGLKFTHEWEKPTSAVLDAFLADHPKPTKMVLTGMSMGGYFAPRAAAFDPRIDGVVAWDACFDLPDAIARPLRLARTPIGASVPDVVWAVNNARWTMGTDSIDEAEKAFAPYRLASVADRIRQDVLIIAGAEDHFIPSHQAADFANSLVNAKSVTTRVFDRRSGGAEHCQTGNSTLVNLAIFDWLEEKFA
jgi:dienelactone hydrolase